MNRINITYQIQSIEQLYRQKKISVDSGVFYANNPDSLFRKYQHLVTWFANTNDGKAVLKIADNKKIALLLPNGYHEFLDEQTITARIYTRSIYAPLLLPALRQFDLLAPFLSDFREAKHTFLSLLGIRRDLYPQLVRELLFDTSTFNPDANVETTSVDGTASREGVNEPFATIVAGAGTNASDGGSNTEDTPYLVSSASLNNFQILRRSFFLFDTSSLPDGAVITNAVLSTYGTASSTKANQLGDADFHIASSNPASNTAIVAADYAARGSTSFGSISFSAFGTDQYNDIILNATGIAAITKTGVSKFSGQLSWDISSFFGGIWFSAASSGFRATFSDTAGSQDPKLTVDFTTTSTSTSTSTSTTTTSTSTTTTSTTTTITTTSTSTSTTTSTSTSTTTTSTSTTTTSTSTTTTSTSWPYSMEIKRGSFDLSMEFSVERKTAQL